MDELPSPAACHDAPQSIIYNLYREPRCYILAQNPSRDVSGCSIKPAQGVTSVWDRATLAWARLTSVAPSTQPPPTLLGCG